MNKPPSHSLLTSDRLYLRAVCSDDVGDSYYRWMSDPEVTQFIESRFLHQSKADILEYVKSQENNDNTLFLAIILKDTDLHIGNIKLDSINWYHRLSEIGIIIGEKRYWGKGYA
jgi:RimJ/RimL family protein N-acetyltransferase